MKKFEADKFWEERLKAKNSLEGVGYEKLGRPFNVWVYKLRRDLFLSMLKRNNLNPQGKAIVDIGSGTGFYLDIWASFNPSELMGMDVSPTAIDRLKEKFKSIDLRVTDIGVDNLDAYKEKFDFASCMDVLFHIVDDERFKQAFVNINKMLKPGAYFVYSDNFLKGKEMRRTHQVSRSETDLLKTIQESGFEIVERKPFMFLTNYPVDSNNMLLKGYWLALENLLYVVKPLGHVLGPVLYWVDKKIVGVAKTTPTTEIVLLRKR
jgi:SAM-dependent methyltransferase